VISFLMTLIGVWNFLPFKPRFYTILSGEKSSAETGFSHRISYITFMSYENETFSVRDNKVDAGKERERERRREIMRVNMKEK